MSVLSFSALRSLADSVGFPDPDLAASVAMAESGGNANAVGDSGHSLGLWQINIPSHPEADTSQLFDPTYNAQIALAISKNGTNWNPWTTYRTGAYQRYYTAPSMSHGHALLVAVALLVGASATAYYIIEEESPLRPIQRLVR
jgi:soluble lytic murein transglycosylase-like protein